MPTSTQSAGVVSFNEAHAAVHQYCERILGRPKQIEDVPLLQSLARVLAAPVTADRDFPPFPRATRDGYALRASDLEQEGPWSLQVVGQVKAGDIYDLPVSPGEAVEIMTGAAVPAGADAVVMVEFTEVKAGTVKIQRAVSVGENIVPAGAEAKAGQELLARGTRLGPAQIAMAAAAGAARLKVFAKPRVAIISTGDELVDLAENPGPSQIRNSNSYSLAALVLANGGEPVQLPIARDEEGKLTELMQQGLKADLLLLSGGVSMGKFDLVEVVLKKLGADFFFTGAMIQPGKPVVFGAIGEKPFFGLPGNPVSVMVTFDLFARQMIEALGGAEPLRLRSAKARLMEEFRTKTGLTRFLPALLHGDLSEPQVEVVPWQGSGDMLAAARSNCYLVVPPDRERFSPGEMVTLLLR